ncbi:hypothetical protein N7E81_08375 [Reichenbachiella carrageenanivorans]|uniref:Glycosyltransferase RgtA/B/C/D-like domain-containing protein n=1 Tax=Reichenbachiella carrageenanivorans TaxID=2979869 RepID=A0ABY6D4N3_9BACT|nr:hypothetical protein [Reichenbachiella carrageenanivorans]UXX81115.1 hypothetical protein N7E81_08375 [Reichenbachiella carrageenanivorans]
MGLQDLIVTPFYFAILLMLAYIIRPAVTSPQTKPYFIPGLLGKFVGALALGLIYQFYYGGGDTFTFHTHGSRWIWQAFIDSPLTGLKLLLSPAGTYDGGIYQYSSKIWMYRDEASLFVIKITAFFDLFTGATYSATALFFATFAFSGHWAMFSVFQKMYPHRTKHLAIACLFIPSVVFWGSGILKDTITLAALCWMTYALLRMTIFNKVTLINLFLILFMGWMIFAIKIYILLCFLIAASVFLYFQYISAIRNPLFKIALAPLLITIFLGGGWLAMEKIAAEDSRYALDNIAQTAMVTAYDIRYGWGARHGDNSGYTLGELDGSIGSLIKLAPQGVIVTLFRPWPWEIKNPLMLLAALESLILLITTIYIFTRKNRFPIFSLLKHPILIFCLSFAVLFAFAVGVSTYNFGTLMRYKIPVMPFYALFLVLLSNRPNPLAK